jgi:hypothetical protein
MTGVMAIKLQRSGSMLRCYVPAPAFPIAASRTRFARLQVSLAELRTFP